MVSSNQVNSIGRGAVQAGSVRRSRARPSLDALNLLTFESEGGPSSKPVRMRKASVNKGKADAAGKGQDLKGKLAELVMKRGSAPAKSSPAPQQETSDEGPSVELSRLMDDGAGSALRTNPNKPADTEIERALCRLGDEGMVF